MFLQQGSALAVKCQSIVYALLENGAFDNIYDIRGVIMSASKSIRRKAVGLLGSSSMAVRRRMGHSLRRMVEDASLVKSSERK